MCELISPSSIKAECEENKTASAEEFVISSAQSL